MNKTQINHVAARLTRKVQSKLAEFTQAIGEDDVEHQLALKLRPEAFLTWIKAKATKAEILEALTPNGCILRPSVLTNVGYRGGINGNNEAILGVSRSTVRAAMAKSALYTRFIGDLRVFEILDGLSDNRQLITAKRAELQEKADLILDQVVLSGSNADVQELIKNFLS